MNISEAEYGRRFHDPAFGIPLAQVVSERLRLPPPLTRKVEGSNLVFRTGDGRWLKIAPPFYADSFETELQVTRGAEGKLPVPIPRILQTGEIDGWRYIISENVPGVQIQHVIPDLVESDFEAIAVDLGQFMACMHKIHIPGFDRDFGPWSGYLQRGVRESEQIHLSRGNSPAWARQIADVLTQEQNRLAQLGPPVLVHADLTTEHVLLHNVSGRWHVCGILDLADAMLAPAELDATVPMLDIFRGRRNHQRRFLHEAGIAPTTDDEGFSLLFMAITLLHPYTFFHDWFAEEIRGGMPRIADIARVVFPD
jgi:hygromycin-B 7''-O-kinase